MDGPTGDERATAGVVLVSGEGSSRRLFWSRRPVDREFLGGFRSFFVGRVESGDENVPVASAVDASVPTSAQRGAAVRELFEETGLLPLESGWIASWSPPPSSNPPLGSWRAFRRRVAEAPESFARLLAEAGYVVDDERLRSVGAWQAPSWAPMATTTEFFVASIPESKADELPDRTNAEHRDGAWISPTEALATWREGEEALSTPIRRIVEWLGRLDEYPTSRPFGDSARRGRHERRAMEIVGGIRAIPLETSTPPPFRHTNCYVIGGDRLVVVDPGTSMGGERTLLEEGLGALRARGASVEAIVLTHHHRDHVDSVRHVRARFEVPVFAHPETARRLEDVSVDESLTDGDRLLEETPHELEVVATPGHTPGHLAFVHLGSRGLIAGDLVAGRGTVVVDPEEGAMSEYLASLERIREREPRWVFPAHGPPIVEPLAHLDQLVEHRRWREREVSRALGDAGGWVGPADLVPDVYDETPVSRWPLARRSLRAHLDHLVEQGRAERRGEKYRGG